jgi:hypothetical protein
MRAFQKDRVFKSSRFAKGLPEYPILSLELVQVKRNRLPLVAKSLERYVAAAA